MNFVFVTEVLMLFLGAYLAQNTSLLNDLTRKRMLDAINPLEWIEFVLFLPRHLLKYFDIDTTDRTSKILNAIWWVVLVVLEYIFGEILTSIKVLILPKGGV